MISHTYRQTGELTGFPSVDKPWRKYYSDAELNPVLPEGNMYEYLLKKNQDALDDLALVYFNNKISYRKLFENIDKTASAFISLGVKKGDVVALAMPNIPENIYCIYALNKIGAVADMIDLRSKGDVLKHYLKETKTKIAVICDLFEENFYNVRNESNVEQFIVASAFDLLPAPVRFVMKSKLKRRQRPEGTLTWKQFFGKNGNKTEMVSNSKDVACIFHTSGTTGVPKGVMLTNLNCNAMAYQGELCSLRFDRGKRIMNQVPPFLAFNMLCSLHVPLIKHMQMVLLPEYKPDKFAENIVKTKATCCLAGPADWGNFLEDKRFINKNIDLSYMVNPISGSDSLTAKKKKEINELLKSKGCMQGVLEGYGMTEIGSAACSNMPNANKDNSVGIPFALNNFCIYDNENDTELSYGELGEICMTGATLMKGYYNNPEETSKVIRKHADGLDWLHSGDLGYIDEDGFIYIEGRIKRVIVCYDGIKIYPFNIERIIMSHKNVSACCVVGADDKTNGRGKVPFAFVVLKDKTITSLDEIKSLCEKNLSEKYIPCDYRIIEELPLTDNGKIAYRKLEKMTE